MHWLSSQARHIQVPFQCTLIGLDGNLETFRVKKKQQNRAHNSWTLSMRDVVLHSTLLSEGDQYPFCLSVPFVCFCRSTCPIRLFQASVPTFQSFSKRRRGITVVSATLFLASPRRRFCHPSILERSSVDVYIHFCSMGRGHSWSSSCSRGVRHKNPRKLGFLSQLCSVGRWSPLMAKHMRVSTSRSARQMTWPKTWTQVVKNSSFSKFDDKSASCCVRTRQTRLLCSCDFGESFTTSSIYINSNNPLTFGNKRPSLVETSLRRLSNRK